MHGIDSLRFVSPIRRFDDENLGRKILDLDVSRRFFGWFVETPQSGVGNGRNGWVGLVVVVLCFGSWYSLVLMVAWQLDCILRHLNTL